MITRALNTATAQQLEGKVGMWMQSAPKPAEDVVNTRGFKLLIATVTETTRGRHEGESAETFIFRAMLANTPFIHVAVEWKKGGGAQGEEGCKDWQEPGRKLHNRLGFFVAAYPRGPQGGTSEDYDPVRLGHVEGHRGKEGGVSL